MPERVSSGCFNSLWSLAGRCWCNIARQLTFNPVQKSRKSSMHCGAQQQQQPQQLLPLCPERFFCNVLLLPCTFAWLWCQKRNSSDESCASFFLPFVEKKSVHLEILLFCFDSVYNKKAQMDNLLYFDSCRLCLKLGFACSYCRVARLYQHPKCKLRFLVAKSVNQSKNRRFCFSFSHKLFLIGKRDFYVFYVQYRRSTNHVVFWTISQQ